MIGFDKCLRDVLHAADYRRLPEDGETWRLVVLSSYASVRLTHTVSVADGKLRWSRVWTRRGNHSLDHTSNITFGTPDEMISWLTGVQP